MWSEVGSFDDLVQLGRQADGDVVRSQTACSGILRSDAPLTGQPQSTPAMAAKLLVVLTDDRVRLLTRRFTLRPRERFETEVPLGKLAPRCCKKTRHRSGDLVHGGWRRHPAPR